MVAEAFEVATEVSRWVSRSSRSSRLLSLSRCGGCVGYTLMDQMDERCRRTSTNREALLLSGNFLTQSNICMFWICRVINNRGHTISSTRTVENSQKVIYLEWWA